jgi:hypothetical protein
MAVAAYKVMFKFDCDVVRASFSGIGGLAGLERRKGG